MNSIAIKIVKLEGVNNRWNQKFYTTNDLIVTIYINNEKIDLTEMVNAERDSKGFFHSSPVVDDYNTIRKQIQSAKFDAMMAKKDTIEAQQEIINSL